MASTILRFRNPNVYQIIDQRAYRVIYGKPLPNSQNAEKNITLYFKYLCAIHIICKKKGVDFKTADRILYMLDKDVNRDIKLR